ncbi:MAG: sugar-binding domain-containing protein [Thermomicrobiales bacterium]
MVDSPAATTPVKNRPGPRSRARACAPPADDQREALLSEIANRYFKLRETQDEIAQAIGRSVATVSRLLARAEDAGVVEMEVRQPHTLVPALQSALVNRFGLQVARVVHVAPSETQASAPRIGEMAARYLTTILEPQSTLTMGSGTHIQAVISALPSISLRETHVVQGLGSIGSRMPHVIHPRLVQMMAGQLDATPHFLPAPLITNTEAERDALARDPYFGAVLRRIAHSDIALIGVGPTEPPYSDLVGAGFMEPWELERLRTRGAVVELLAEFFDVQGRVLCTDIQPRVVGMRHRDLEHAGTVLAVAGGEGKALALLGALRSGLIDVLVTDSLVTRSILALADEHPGPSYPARPARSARQALWWEQAGHVDAPVADAHEDFLDATLRELDRVGYQKLSPRTIAQDVQQPAGAIYHAWSSRATLVRDAWSQRQARSTPPGASLAEDMQGILAWLQPEMPGRVPYLAMRTMAAEAQLDPDFRPIFQALEHKGSLQVQSMLLRAQERGELGSGASIEVLADMISGAIWRRLLFGLRPIDAAFMSDLTRVVLRAASDAPPSATGTGSGDPGEP